MDSSIALFASLIGNCVLFSALVVAFGVLLGKHIALADAQDEIAELERDLKRAKRV